MMLAHLMMLKDIFRHESFVQWWFKKGEYMFKKILQEIGELRKQIDGLYDAITKRSYILKHYEEEIDSLRKSLNVQTELNRQLMTSSFENNHNNQIEVAVFVPYRGTPYVFKDGKKVSTDHMTSFDIDWSYDRKTEVTVRSE